MATENENSDTEEMLVYVEFEELINEELNETLSMFKIIGIDTDKPMLQIGNQLYQGELTETLGTYVFFEEDEQRKTLIKPVHQKDDIDKSMKYVTKTERAINMKRIFVHEKDDSPIEVTDSNYKFPATYSEALDQLCSNDNCKSLVNDRGKEESPVKSQHADG